MGTKIWSSWGFGSLDYLITFKRVPAIAKNPEDSNSSMIFEISEISRSLIFKFLGAFQVSEDSKDIEDIQSLQRLQESRRYIFKARESLEFSRSLESPKSGWFSTFRKSTEAWRFLGFCRSSMLPRFAGVLGEPPAFRTSRASWVCRFSVDSIIPRVHRIFETS